MANGLFGGGTGTKDTPYLVEDAIDLAAVRNNLKAHYKQIADIDLKGDEWLPIGFLVGEDSPAYFSGSFDGGNLNILNLKISQTEKDNIGLFAIISGIGVLKNIHLINPITSGRYTIGTLLGGIEYSDEDSEEAMAVIENCTAENVEVSGENGVGGLIGYIQVDAELLDCHTSGRVGNRHNSSAVGGVIGGVGNYIYKMRNCSSTCSVSGINQLGGIGGYIWIREMGEISNCHAKGQVTSEYDAGGLVGILTNVEVIRCSASGDVSGIASAGGFVCQADRSRFSQSFSVGDVTISDSLAGGFMSAGINVTVNNCYSCGDIVGRDQIGGFVGGLFEENTISNSVSFGSVKGKEAVGGYAGEAVSGTVFQSVLYDTEKSGQNDTGKGEPKTSAELMDPNTYDGWDFVNIWTMKDGQLKLTIELESDTEPPTPEIPENPDEPSEPDIPVLGAEFYLKFKGKWFRLDSSHTIID